MVAPSDDDFQNAKSDLIAIKTTMKAKM